MNDIVKRLADFPIRFGNESEDAAKIRRLTLVKEAAAEIERLTAENNELRTGEYLVKVIEERERLRKALKALLDRDERNTCQHENTHRGGFLWEICDDCGATWADDEGGKPQWDDPAEWVEARTILLGINKTAASEASQC